jgi:hypothetical protein
MLTNKTIQNITGLLAHGFSQRKTAAATGVSLSTVQRIAHGKRSFNSPSDECENQPTDVLVQPVRCPLCGALVTVLPCLACAVRLNPAAIHNNSVAYSANSSDITLDLHGEVYQRYLEMHNQVKAEIDANIRTPNSAILSDFVSKY